MRHDFAAVLSYCIDRSGWAWDLEKEPGCEFGCVIGHVKCMRRAFAVV